LQNLSSNAFRTVLEIDTLGSYNTLKATVPYLKLTQGSILFVSATLHYRGTILQAHVSAAKAGVDALSQVVAVEYGPWGIRSNVIAPGAIGGTEGADRLVPKEMRERTGQKIPLQRLGTVWDIADCTVFVFSEAASYITGTVFVVDGGQKHQYARVGRRG
jgi:2,4-dienoyl-CoA reductase [(3E)-enoyl-CoA-producing], peroxisomal